MQALFQRPQIPSHTPMGPRLPRIGHQQDLLRTEAAQKVQDSLQDHRDKPPAELTHQQLSDDRLPADAHERLRRSAGRERSRVALSL